MSRVADQDHAVPGVGEAAHLDVHLLHEWAGCVDRGEVAVGGFAVDLGCDAVRGEHQPCAPRDFRC